MKVVDVDAVMEVSDGKQKQDVLVGDSTGAAGVTVWESEIGKLEEGGSLQFDRNDGAGVQGQEIPFHFEG